MCCCWHWKQYRSSGIIESSYNSCFIQEEISNLGFYWRSLLVKSAKYCHCIRKSFSCNIHLWSIEALRCYHESATVVYSSWHVRKYGFCFPACQIIASCCCLHLNACVYFFVEMQVLWLSDGAHTVHVTSVSDVEHSVRETDENENTEKEMQIAGLPKSISWLFRYFKTIITMNTCQRMHIYCCSSCSELDPSLVIVCCNVCMLHEFKEHN